MRRRGLLLLVATAPVCDNSRAGGAQRVANASTRRRAAQRYTAIARAKVRLARPAAPERAAQAARIPQALFFSRSRSWLFFSMKRW